MQLLSVALTYFSAIALSESEPGNRNWLVGLFSLLLLVLPCEC